jgi:hypothetical protein
VTLASPSHDPGLPQDGVPHLSEPSAPAPVKDGPAGQHAYAAGSANAPLSHYPAEMSTPLDASNQTHRTPGSLFTQGNRSLAPGAGSAFTPPLAGLSQINSAHLCICHGDYWLVGCNLVWEHYSLAMNYPVPSIRHSCDCPPGLMMVLKSCPNVASHLLYWVSYI